MSITTFRPDFDVHFVDATFTITPNYKSAHNVTEATLNIVSSDGSSANINGGLDVFVVGDATSEPTLLAQLQQRCLDFFNSLTA